MAAHGQEDGDGPPLAALPPFSPFANAGGRGERAVWRQIAGVIRALVDSGTWTSGARLPIEAELAAHFRVNRHTLRRALAELAEEGYIAAARGRGTFVSAGAMAVLLVDGRSLFPVGSTGRPQPVVSLLGQTVGEAGRALGQKLAIEPSRPVIALDMRLAVSGRPIGLATVWLSHDRFARLGDMVRREGSLEAALAAAGVTRWRASSSIFSSRRGDKREHALIGVGNAATLSMVDTLFTTPTGGANDQPLALVRIAVAAERASLCVQHDAD